MNVPLAERAFGIERGDGVCQGMAVQHADVKPCPILRRDHLPVKGLIDDEILSVRDWKTSCTDVFAAGACDQEVPVVAENLLDEFAALVDTILKGLALADFLELCFDVLKSARSLGKPHTSDVGFVTSLPYPGGVPLGGYRDRRAMCAKQKRQQVFRLRDAAYETRRGVSGKACVLQLLGALHCKSPRRAFGRSVYAEFNTGFIQNLDAHGRARHEVGSLLRQILHATSRHRQSFFFQHPRRARAADYPDRELSFLKAGFQS